MKIQDITNFLETIAPKGLQENYDNVGLLTGSARGRARAGRLRWCQIYSRGAGRWKNRRLRGRRS